MPPPVHCPANTILRLCGQRRRRKFPPQRGPARLLVVCEDCGLSSRHRVIVARHWRFCHPATSSGRHFTCDRCTWTSDTLTTYVEHRRTAHGDRVIVTRNPYKLTTEQTQRESAASLATDDAPVTSSAAEPEVVMAAGTCVTSSADDDDERSLDENLRPMDGQICLPDVDAGLTEPFQTVTKDWSTSNSSDYRALAGQPEVEIHFKEKPPVVDEPLSTSGGLFRCRYCRYTNAHKWKMASHMKSSHAGRLIFRCPQCPRFVTDRRVEWCAHRSRHTGKTVFSCTECAYETTMKRNFERHLERHVAGGPRRCTICSYSSTGEGAIQRHMAEYHPPSPPPASATTTDTRSPPDVAQIPVENRKVEVQLPTTSSSVLLFQPSKAVSTPNGMLGTPPSSLGKLPIISCDMTGRWTCPMCPLSYKRPADLNRHMKQKHEVALKDFAVSRSAAAPVVVTGAVSETRLTAVPVQTTVVDVSISEDVVSDQPLNLSLKDSPTMTAVNLTVSELHQTEPLDLSVVRPRSEVVDDDSSVVRQTKSTLGYPCNQCTYVSKRASDLRRHQLVHCSSKRYRCPYCVGDRSYKLQFDLGRHMAKVHGTAHPGDVMKTAISSKLKETGVGQSPVSPVATGSSIYGAVVGTGSSMACPYCQYVGKSSSELERHARLHSGEKPHRCPHCSFQTVWNSDLVRHIQKAHGEDGDPVQPDVDHNMNFESARKRLTAPTRIGNFIADISRYYTGEEQKPTKVEADRQRGRCPLCPFVCDLPSVMSVHLESHEKDAGHRFVCTVCGSTFAGQREGREHAASHHGDVTASGTTEFLIVEVKSDQALSSSSSAAESTVTPLDGGSGGAEPVDVDALAEQYANEVTEMFYGNETPKPPGYNVDATSVRRFAMSVPCRSARADRCRPFKCSHCGRRSNWRWDLKKHIRASRHPNADVIELSAEEARRSFHADLVAAYDRPAPPTNKPYRCFRCGHWSNWKSDVTKHIRALHPLSRVVVMDDEEATATLAQYEHRLSDEKAKNQVDCKTKSEPEEKALYTVDRQKLKRLRCSACPYRSNFRSDVGRHIRHKHRDDAATVQIAVMSAVEAAATLQDYMDTWTHRKIVNHDERLDQEALDSCEADPNEVDEAASGKRAVQGDGFEFVDGEDETLPWKCAACEFIDPTKQVVVDHWQRYHCTQVKLADQVMPSDDTSSQNTADISSKSAQVGSWSPNMKKKKVRPVANKTLKCDICPYRTNKLGLLTIHKTYHRPQAKNTYKCPHCPYYVCAPRLLHQHTRIHVDGVQNGDVRAGNGSKDQASGNGEAATKLRCSMCPFVGRTKNDVIYHRQFHRARSTAPYRCPRCPFWVSDKRLLAQHQTVHREPTRPPVGPDVDGRESAKAGGIGTQGGGKTVTSPCSDLGVKPVVRRGSSDEGQRRRVARTLWRCDRCPYVTAKRSQHRTHRQLHGSCQRHTCRLCDYSVGGLHLLMQHVRLHHRQETGNKPAKDPPEDNRTSSPTKDLRPVFRCDRCPYSNSRRDHLLCHARFHASGGPLRCPQCDYSVSKVHLLTQHLRVHQMSADAENNSSKTGGAHAAKDQFMKSLSLTTR